jgi:mono/diheme cytochrome c family protein
VRLLIAALLCSALFVRSATLLLGAPLLQKAAKVAKPQINPLQNDPGASIAGEKLFARECSGCHGEGGKGRGRPHTPVLATDLVRRANPGALFWILRNGSSSHRMPSFSHLPEEQRWQIITFLQNRGLRSMKE